MIFFFYKQEKIEFADKFIDFNKGRDHDESGENDGEDSSDESDSDQDQVERAEKRRLKRQAKKDSHKSWIDIWTSKIVDNLEISLKNIHVRYEDDSHLNGSHSLAAVVNGPTFEFASGFVIMGGLRSRFNTR